jgi:eukaryotic-like serine/threonine-protein kinase
MNQILVTGPEPRDSSTRAAEELGRYRVIRTLAFGGMAQILLAVDSSTGKLVVVKRILPQYAANPEFVQFFIHEGRLGQRLKHANLVETLEASESDGQPYIALEYLRGVPAIELLRAAARAHVELPLGAAVRIVADTARGLHYAHTATGDDGSPLGVVHRDVTPHNLFVCADGVTKVLDFGIAKAASQLHQTRTGTIKGKFAYLAPEQIRGQPIDRRVDVFALGIVLHELLTLKPLFRGHNDGETLQRVLELEVPPPEKVRAGVPPGLGAVALRALQRDPDRRLPSAAALADSIEAVAQAEYIDASPEVVAELLAELCPIVDDEPAPPAAEDQTADPPEAELRVDAGSVELDETAPVAVGVSTGPQPAQTGREPSDAQPLEPLTPLQPMVTGTRERGRRSAGRAALLVSAGVLAVGGALLSRGCVMRLARAPLSEAPAAMVAPRELEAPPPPPAQLEPSARPRAMPSPALAAAPREATLKIETQGAPTFVVDGHALKPSADGLLHLQPGRHVIVVSSAQLTSPRTLTVELRADEAAVRAVRLGRGQLRVAVSPWAEVSVDGHALGTTPLPPLDLAEGPHTVTLKNGELNVVTKKHVVIAPNKEVVLKANLFGG